MEKRKKRTEERNGQKKEKIEIAKKMLEKNIEIEVILELTGLSKDEIIKLKK